MRGEPLTLTFAGAPSLEQPRPSEAFAAYHALLREGELVELPGGRGAVILALHPPPKLPVSVHLIQEVFPEGMVHLRVGTEIVAADPSTEQGRELIAAHYPWEAVGFQPIPPDLVPFLQGHARALPEVSPEQLIGEWRSAPPPTQLLLAKLGVLPEAEAEEVLLRHGVWS